MAMGYSETRNSLDVDSMLLPWITLIDLFFFEIIYLSIRWRARRTSKDIDIYIDGDDCVSVRTINQVVCFLVTSLLTMRIDFSIDNLICPFSRPFFPSLSPRYLSLSLSCRSIFIPILFYWSGRSSIPIRCTNIDRTIMQMNNLV